MSVYLTLTDITYEVAAVFRNNLVFGKYFNMEYDDRFAKTGAKIGDTTNLRLPVRNTVSDGDEIVIQDDIETSTPLRLDKRKHIGLQFSAVDRLLSIDDFSNRFILPKVAQLANQFDADCAAMSELVYNAVGTPGVTPNASSVYLGAGVKLDNFAAPQDEQRFCVVPSQNHATLVAAEQTLFNSQTEISKQYRKGRIGVAHGLNFYMDQNCHTHTYGVYSGTPLVDGANQVGTSLLTKGWGSGVSALNLGDLFTIAGVYQVNPASYQSSGALQQFRVVQNVNDTTGAMTITIDPEIIIAGAFKTVDSAPADNAPITVLGTTGVVSPQGLVFHKDAFAAVMVDLPEPGAGASSKRISDKDLGISMLVTEQFDISKFRTIMRVDILYGIAPYRKQLAVRVQS